MNPDGRTNLVFESAINHWIACFFQGHCGIINSANAEIQLAYASFRAKGTG